MEVNIWDTHLATRKFCWVNIFWYLILGYKDSPRGSSFCFFFKFMHTVWSVGSLEFWKTVKANSKCQCFNLISCFCHKRLFDKNNWRVKGFILAQSSGHFLTTEESRHQKAEMDGWKDVCCLPLFLHLHSLEFYKGNSTTHSEQIFLTGMPRDLCPRWVWILPTQ